MSNSFISFKGNGFHVQDNLVEGMLLLLFEEIDQVYRNTSPWLNEYKKLLAMESLPLAYGNISMRFNEIVTDEARKNILLHITDNLHRKITDTPDFLNGMRLNALRRTVRYFLVDTGEFLWPYHEIERQIEEMPFPEKLSAADYLQKLELVKKLLSGELNNLQDQQ